MSARSLLHRAYGVRVILTRFVDLRPLRGNKRAILIQATLLGLSFFGINFEECHDSQYSVIQFFSGHQLQWTRIFSSSLLLNARSDQPFSPDPAPAVTPQNQGH